MPWPQCRRKDAVVLDHWFPGLARVDRAGGTAYANTLGGAVRTVFEFNAKTTRKFFIGMAGGKIWDISAAGAGVSLATGFASDVLGLCAVR